jgi:hypothetical protein
MPDRTRTWTAARILVIGAAAAALALALLPRPLHHSTDPTPTPSPTSAALVGGPLPSLAAASAWTAGAPLPDSLSGHVVALAFVSLNLPASARVAGALESWHEAYARYGLRVIGVEVPEFAFAAEPRTLQSNTTRLGLRFTVGLDPLLEVWRGFGADGERPRVVVADAHGRVALDASGAEAFAGAETKIRELLQAARPEVHFPAAAPPSVTPPASESPHPPVQLGRARIAGGPLAETMPNHAMTFTAQLRYQVEGDDYTPYPVGRWTVGADGVTAERGGAENFIALRYHAGALGAVLGPGQSGPVRVWILRDDQWLPASALGADARLDGRGASYVLVSEPRLYALTRESPDKHVIKLSPDVPGATFYALTFEPFAPGAVPGP